MPQVSLRNLEELEHDTNQQQHQTGLSPVVASSTPQADKPSTTGAIIRQQIQDEQQRRRHFANQSDVSPSSRPWCREDNPVIWTPVDEDDYGSDFFN